MKIEVHQFQLSKVQKSVKIFTAMETASNLVFGGVYTHITSNVQGSGNTCTVRIENQGVERVSMSARAT